MVPLSPERIAALAGEQAREVVQQLQQLQLHERELRLQNDELRQAQEALRGGQQWARQLFDHAPVGYLLLAADGRMLDANLAAAELLQDDVSLLLGRRLADYVLPGQRERVEAQFARAADDARPRRCEARLRRRNGSSFWAELHCALHYQGSGQEPRLLITLDELRRPALALESAPEHCSFAEAIVEAMHEPLLVLDLDLNVMRANPAFLRTFACGESQVLGRSMGELTQGWSHQAELERVLRKVARHGGLVRDYDLSLDVPRRGPSVVPINVQRITVAGHDTVLLVAIRDITLRKQAERALIQSGRRKEVFLAQLGHELRSPLAALFYAAEALTRGPDRARATEIIQRQVRHLRRLADDLLDLSRITSNRINLRPSVVSVQELVDEVLDEVQPTLSAVRQMLDLQLDPNLTHVRVDLCRMSQILVNLINNASRASAGGARIVLRVRPRGTDVEFTVSDQGRGLTPHELLRIFEPFFQVEPGDRRGLGLGLPLASALASLHGGSLQASSAGRGQGTEMVLRIPDAVELGQVVQRSGAPAEPRTGQRQAQLLVVDDDEDCAAAIAMALEMSGYQVQVAHDGEQALALLCSARPQAALLDLGLPGINGFELARRIRARPELAEMGLMAFSGWGRAADAQRAQEAGFDLHLVKPVELDQLVQQVKRLLELALARGGVSHGVAMTPEIQT